MILHLIYLTLTFKQMEKKSSSILKKIPKTTNHRYDSVQKGTATNFLMHSSQGNNIKEQ